ncbi:MAG: 30S ribosomal protein S8 [Patescibacteria group bacterium]|nr:30S ribosomal protein S8 [Patescibacteria group bacterium]
MDTIANMLTKIKNVQAVRKPKVEIPYSQNREAIASVLEEYGYLSKVRVYKPKGKRFKMLSLDLKYLDGDPFISKVRKISKPGQRIYSSAEDLPLALGGKGLVIVSTSQGVMSAKEAKKRNLGGEIICEVW